MTKAFRRLALLLAFLAFPSAVSAHRLDEYLQATLAGIDPGVIRLQVNLTPGVAVAEQVLELIDRDRDGLITTNEAAAYAELVKRDLTVRLDGRRLELRLTASYFPEPTEFLAGTGIIQMEYSVTPGVVAVGLHKLTLENRHLPDASVYLFNAARPGSTSIRITGQKRNENQSTGEIAFEFHPPPNPSIPAGILVSLVALLFVLCSFLLLSHSPGSERPADSLISAGHQPPPAVPPLVALGLDRGPQTDHEEELKNGSSSISS